MEDGKGQADPEGLQDLHLLDGLLARRRQDAMPRERRKIDSEAARQKARNEGRRGFELPSYRYRSAAY